jgi:hypothetical protein
MTAAFSSSRLGYCGSSPASLRNASYDSVPPGQCAAAIHYEETFTLHSRPYLFPDVEEHIFDDQEAISSVVHDVSEFVRVLPQAQGVYDGSHRGNP